MILLEQGDVFLLEQHDAVGRYRTTVQGLPWDHLGTTFGKIRKLFPAICGLIWDLFGKPLCAQWVLGRGR